MKVKISKPFYDNSFLMNLSSKVFRKCMRKLQANYYYFFKFVYKSQS